MPSSPHMQRAIELARTSIQEGGGPFGAVIVRGDEVIAEGSNRVVIACDPSAHAEVEAIRAACRSLESHVLAGCEIYASCEPCPMCLAAIWWARIERVHFACGHDDAAAIGFDDAELYHEIARPLDQRVLPLVQSMREKGLEVFQDWQSHPDRIPY